MNILPPFTSASHLRTVQPSRFFPLKRETRLALAKLEVKRDTDKRVRMMKSLLIMAKDYGDPPPIMTRILAKISLGELDPLLIRF